MRDQLAASSPASIANPILTAGTLVSTGGWFIDRGRRHEKNNILIDLCEEEPTNTATNVCTCGGHVCTESLFIFDMDPLRVFIEQMTKICTLQDILNLTN